MSLTSYRAAPPRVTSSTFLTRHARWRPSPPTRWRMLPHCCWSNLVAAKRRKCPGSRPGRRLIAQPFHMGTHSVTIFRTIARPMPQGTRTCTDNHLKSALNWGCRPESDVSGEPLRPSFTSLRGRVRYGCVPARSTPDKAVHGRASGWRPSARGMRSRTFPLQAP